MLSPKKLKSFATKKPADEDDDEESSHAHGADGGDKEQDDKGDGDNPGDGEGDESDEAIASRVGGEVQSGKVDADLMEKLADFDPEEGNPPSWVSDEGTWNRAKKAVEPKWDEYDEPYAVVAHVYREMGGEISSTD
jgi:hypothetical protein